MPTHDDDAEIARILPQWAAQVREYRAPAGPRAPTGPLRGGHPKSHGIVRGALTIHTVDRELRVGLFSAPRTFPCRLRFSNVQGGAFADTRDLRGLAVKLLGDDERHTLHDFLCSSVEVLPPMATRDLTPARFLEPMEELLARDPSHPDAPRLDTNLLTARYFSVTAYAFGRDRACKYAFFPAPESADAVTLDRGGADDLAASLAHNLAARRWRFSLCVQLAEGPEHSVDDVTRRWATRWREVATLTVDPQPVTPPASDPLERRFYTSPAHCHPDHQALGAMARVRLAVYATSRAARGATEVEFPFRPWRQRVAVVGAGGAGLSAAAALASEGHEVVVYESSDRLGGHATSVRVGDHSVDPGFGVFTPHTHPNLLRLCERWSIPVEPLARFDEARSWRTPDGAVSYTRLADIPFAREVLAEAAAFRREELPRLLRDPAWDDVTLGEYLQQRSFSRAFVRYFVFGQVVYLFPGHPESYYLAMPLRPLLRHAFDLARHGEQPLLRMKGGSAAYIDTLAAGLRARGVTFHTRAAVTLLGRDRTGVDLSLDGVTHRFDHVILAVAPHRALRVLGDRATADERRVLGSVGHTINAPVAHRDPSWLPRDESHHAYHNMVVPRPEALDAPMTLAATKRAPCNLDGHTPCLVTHDYDRPTDDRPSGPSARVAFEHVDIDRATFAARAALPSLQGVARTWFAGAWTRGLTWHDDAIASGLVAANGIVTPLEAQPVLCSYATAPDRRDDRPLPLASFERVLATVPDKEFLAFADERGDVVERHTPRTLDARTRRLALALIRHWNTRPGDRVILAFPPGLAFFESFVACLRAGLVPVPVYPPVPGSPAGNLAAFAHIVRDADARLGLCPAPYDEVLPGYLGEVLPAGALPPDLRWRADDGPEVAALDPSAWSDVPRRADDVAFLQYTSGSTGDPKGVVISHGNLAHQAHAVCAETLGLGPDSVCVSWLPMYHDFGLISGLLQSWQLGLRNVFLSPQSFAARPALWMETCHRERATATAAPDFAYALVVRRTTPEQRAAWDLSSLSVVMSAAEPVRPATVDAFLKAFRASGLAAKAFCPAYGLAEHTVGVTVGGRRLAHFDRAALAAEKVARPGDFALVGNGPAPPGVDVRIVDADTGVERAAGELGEIWVDSPSKALGYWGRPEESARRFEARIAGSDRSRAYLRTGDVGFLSEGELFVTGRLKDVVIVRGRNHAAPDLERALDGAHPALRPGGIVALQDPLEDGLLVVAELARTDASVDAPSVTRALRAALARDVGLAIATVALLPPRTLPRTTSGKLQRSRVRELFAASALPIVHRCDDALVPPPAADAAATTVRPALTEAGLLDALTRVVAESARVRLDPDEALDGALHLDSLQLVEMGVAIERATGRAVTAADLERFNTLRSLARHLSGGVARAPRLRLLAGPSEPVPVFLAGPMFLRARDLGELAGVLGHGRRVYALEREGDSLAEVVAAQVEAVRETLDRARRCVLVGVSFGGLLNCSVAAGLARHGVEVPRVVMFDTYHPSGYVDAERPPPGRELHYVAALLAASLRVALPAEAQHDLSVALLHLLRPYRRAVAPDADVTVLRRDLERHARWMREAEALYSDDPPRLPATDATYFRATDRPADGRNVEAWEALHCSVEVHPGAGDHFAVVRDAPRLVESALRSLHALDVRG